MKSPYPRRRRRRRRGFILLEVLVVLMLMGVVLLASGRLFETTIRVGHAAATAQDDAVSLDAAVAALRRDVWSATKLDTANARDATMTLPGDRSVAWTIMTDNAGDAIIRREANQPPQRCKVPPGASLTSDDIELVLRIPATASIHGGEIRLPRQVQLIGRMTP